MNSGVQRAPGHGRIQAGAHQKGCAARHGAQCRCLLRDMGCGGLGSVRLTVGLDDLKGLFQPIRFCDSVMGSGLQPPPDPMETPSLSTVCAGPRPSPVPWVP